MEPSSISTVRECQDHTRKLRILFSFLVNYFSPLRLFWLFLLTPPSHSILGNTYGSFDLGIKVPSSFIRSLILNLLLRSTLRKTAQMLEVIFTLTYNIQSISSKTSLSAFQMLAWSLKSSDRVNWFALLHMDILRQKFYLYCKNVGLLKWQN